LDYFDNIVIVVVEYTMVVVKRFAVEVAYRFVDFV
jgi:hypothetical protein